MGDSVTKAIKPDLVICVLCGLPGAGKTYLANRSKQLFEESLKIHILSYDDHIETESDLTAESWKKRRNRVHFECKELALTLKCIQTFEHIRKPHAIIIDDNMFLKSMRYSYFQLAKELGVGFCQIHVQASLGTCFNRVKLRNSSLPSSGQIEESTIERIYSKFDEPNGEKNFWELNTISFSSELVDYNVLKDFLTSGAKSFVPSVIEKSGEKLCGFNSFSHQADLLMRHLIKERVDDYRKKGFHVDGKQLSNVKKCLMKVFQAQSLDDILNDVISLSAKCQTLLASLDWPLRLWYPEDVCEQVVSKCFDNCLRENLSIGQGDDDLDKTISTSSLLGRPPFRPQHLTSFRL